MASHPYLSASRSLFPLLGAALLVGAAGCGPSVTGGDGGSGGGGEGGNGGGTCEYDGTTYEAGESFPSTDGCNDCFCGDDGTVGCTDAACVATCTYQGQTYQVGQSYYVESTCAMCTCMEQDVVACTTGACPSCEYLGEYYPPGETFPAGDGCNTCTCMSSGEVACTEKACPIELCSDEGYFHAPGETWLSLDQCLSCSCQAGAEVVCSDNGPCSTCFYAGVLHESGQGFPALDGCNTCICDLGGVSCSDVGCACNPAEEWWRDYINEGQGCEGIDFGCAEPTTPFENACGCGCEQPAWCPPAFDCQPPTPCDVEQIQQLCPMSVIAL